MSTRTNYDEMAGRIDYTTLERKLEQMKAATPPRKRKTAADLLDPVRPKLLELHALGWTYEQLGKALGEWGLVVKVATLRNYLGGRGRKARRGAKKTDNAEAVTN